MIRVCRFLTVGFHRGEEKPRRVPEGSDLLPGNWSVQNEENLLESRFGNDSGHEEDAVHRAGDCLCPAAG